MDFVVSMDIDIHIIKEMKIYKQINKKLRLFNHKDHIHCLLNYHSFRLIHNHFTLNYHNLHLITCLNYLIGSVCLL